MMKFLEFKSTNKSVIKNYNILYYDKIISFINFLITGTA